MTEWGYLIEQYKVQLHLYEVIAQSLSTPLIVLVTATLIYFLFRRHVGRFIEMFEYAIRNSNEINVADFLNLKMREQKIENDASQYSSGVDKDRPFNIDNPTLARMFIDNLDRVIDGFRIFVLSEQAKGNFKDVNIICSNNDQFIESMYKGSELKSLYSLYESMLGWKKNLEKTPDEIDDEAIKKIALCTSMLHEMIALRADAFRASLAESTKRKVLIV